MGGTLSGALLKRNHRQGDGSSEYHPLAGREELDIPSSSEELSKAIVTVACGKDSGNDDIPPDVAKASTLPNNMHELLLQCWGEGMAVRDMRDSNIITLCEHKGIFLYYCWEGLRLSSTEQAAVTGRTNTPRGSVPVQSRKVIDMVFSLPSLKEKCREQRQKLYIAFVDLTKAFDLVNRNALFTMLQRIVCPPNLLTIIKSFHENIKSTVQHDGYSSDLDFVVTVSQGTTDRACFGRR